MNMGARKTTLFFVILIFIVMTLFGLFFDFTVESGEKNPTDIQIESREAMGTIITIEVVGESPEKALDSAFEEIERIEYLMNIYDQDSEISRLNKQGYLDEGSPDLVYVINRSIFYGEITGGAFDITIRPILMLWKNKINSGEYPTGAEINSTLLLVNYSNISVINNSVSFKSKDMVIDLGGIAKGYGVDQAVTVLKKQGIESGYVNAGGDGMYFGTKPDGSPWRVGLRNPDNKTDAITIIEISDMAVTTSGNYERFFNESARLSHISDPRTGMSSQSLISATVIASSAMEADVLATAVFVLGPVEGMELVERTENTEALLITPERQIIKSSGFDSYESEK
jgi:thiamine biosynthesis lipoprotein